MSKIDIDKFVCSLMQYSPIGKDVKYLISEALKAQGLIYIDGEVELNERTKPRFKVGDVIIDKKDGFTFTITDIDDKYYTFDNGGCWEIANQDDFELYLEPKSKFRVGDWVVDNAGNILQIKSASYGTYEFTDDSSMNISDGDNGHLRPYEKFEVGNVIYDTTEKNTKKHCFVVTEVGCSYYTLNDYIILHFEDAKDWKIALKKGKTGFPYA